MIKEPLKLCMQSDRIEVGCDEAGRGCLAGPVFAAAVVLPPTFKCDWLNDSKQLTERQRLKLRDVIENEAVSYAVAQCSPVEIDELNILWASVAAMHKALSSISVPFHHILVDGNRFRPFNGISHSCIVKGDSTYLSIAAASVLAKTYRDEYMTALHSQFPVYQWNKNKGYPTKKHREAIRLYGATVHHRKSFTLLDNQLQINWI